MILEAGGSEPEEARIVADHLVLANLSGHDSHGVGMLPAYERSLGNGTLKPNQQVDLVHDDGPIMMFDGGMGYGQVVGRQATAAAIERCRSTGVVPAPVRYCHHLGRIGTYGEQVAEAGLASLHFVNVVGHQALVAPYRGTDARYSDESDLPVTARQRRAAADPPRHGHQPDRPRQGPGGAQHGRADARKAR